MSFRFAEPLWLLLLAALPLLAWWIGARGRRAAITFSSTLLARRIARAVPRGPGRLRLPLRLAIILFLILALARPQGGRSVIESDSSGVDIMLVLDLSFSMWAHDFELNGELTDRLTVVKDVVREFIRRRPHDRIGLVAFGADAYLVSPLTLNHAWLLRNLERLELGSIDGTATAIGSAIVTAANRLRPVRSESKLIVLLTDGDNNAGAIQPPAAAEAAAAHGIRIYAIGAGREGIVPIPRIGRDGRPLRDVHGRIRMVSERSSIDFPQLERLADITSGKAYRASDTQGLQAIYREIDQLEKTEVRLRQRTDYREWFHVPLAVALTLLMIDLVWLRLLHRRLP